MKILPLRFALLVALLPAFAGPLRAADNAAAPAAAGKQPLRQILVGESVEAVEKFSAPGAGFVVFSPALAGLDVTDLRKRLADGEGRTIEPNLLTAITQFVEAAARQQNFPNATTIVPTQKVSDGVLRIALILDPPVIKRIVVGLGAADAVQFAPTAPASFVVASPAVPHVPLDDLNRRLAVGEGKPFQEKLVAAIVQVVEVFFRQHEFPAASAFIPPQNASDGTLRVAVQLGKVRNIKVEGNRWFSASLLQEKLRIEKGDIIRVSELDRAISWTNNNPFRRVRVQIDPVPDTGEADLIVAVQESLPLRAQVTYDNGGNAVVGRHRMTASTSYANLWGRDHQGSVQLISTDKGLRTYAGYGLDYRVPLPWRDQLHASISYVDLQPSFLDGLLTQKGENVSASLRYTHTVQLGSQKLDLFGGTEYKQSNNNLLWLADASTRVPVLTNKTDIFQFTAGGSLLRRDSRGGWILGANAVFSPGRFNSRNNDASFDASRPFAKSRYFYTQLSFQRLLVLGRGWDYSTRGVLQVAQKNLLPSEQLFAGGATTVRGFNENVMGGDRGFVLANELLAPNLPLPLKRLPKGKDALDLRFLGFFDVAKVKPKIQASLDQRTVALASTGLGLRANLASHLSVTADYGWQLTNLPYAVPDRSRGHVRVTLSY
jgi:hemolysin activation/secretion protein